MVYGMRIPGTGRHEAHGIPTSATRHTQEFYPNNLDALRRKLSLNRLRGGDKKPEAGWPKTPHALSWALRRVSPNLRAAGIEVALPDKADKRRIITIIAAKVGETLPKTPTSPTAGKNPPDPSTFMAEGVGNVGTVGIQNPTLQSSDEGETDPEATTVVIDNDDDEEVPF